MDSSKKEEITDDSPSLAGDPKFRSVTGLNSASSLSSRTFRQGINPQATSTPYPPGEREKSSHLPLMDTPHHTLFQTRAPKQDPTLSDTALKLRKPKVRWPDEEEGGKLTTTRDRSTSPSEPKRLKDRHQSEITDEQEEERSTTHDRSTSPSERKSLQQPSANNGPSFAEVPELVNMEPHTSPSRTPVFPLGRGAHAEAIHIDYPEPIDPTASSSRVSASPSRWSEGFRNETKSLVASGCEEDSSSSVEAFALMATTRVEGKTAATDAEANYMARSALYQTRLQGAINKRNEASASAFEVEAAISAKKQQLDEAMRGVDVKYQCVLEKLKQARQVPATNRERR